MLDFERLDEGLNRAGARDQCPMCGSDTWSPGSEYVLLQAVADDMNVNIGRGYLAYELMCETCGFYRLHSVEHLRSLTKDLEPKQGSEDSENTAHESG